MKTICVTILLGLCAIAYGIDMSKLKPFSLYAHAMFLSEDLDQDGSITMSELTIIFDRYDKNHDGKESRQEYTTYICDVDPDLYQVGHYLFDAWDFNGDHHLDLNDYQQFFNAMDTNGDGLVINTEFIDYFVALFTHIETIETNHPHGNSHEHGASSCHGR